MRILCNVLLFAACILANPLAYSEEYNGLPKKEILVTLKVSKTVYRVNDEVDFVYRITNLTDKQSTFVFDGSYATDLMRIFSNNIRCSIVRKSWKWPWFKKAASDAFITLAPGETKERRIIAYVRKDGVDTPEGIEAVKGVFLDFKDVYIALDSTKKRLSLEAAVELRPNEEFVKQGRGMGLQNVRTLEAYSNEVEFSVEL